MKRIEIIITGEVPTGENDLIHQAAHETKAQRVALAEALTNIGITNVAARARVVNVREKAPKE